MAVWRFVRPEYFRGETLPRRSDDLVLTAQGTEALFGLPDSRTPATVIAPDLSNLPPGRHAVNAETLEPVDEPAELPPADPDLPRSPGE
jgi:hypothetical protein